MNKNQRQVQQTFLESEKEILRELNTIYLQAQMDIEDKIFDLMNRKDVENIQNIIYQKEYQKALKKQIEGILDNLNSNQFTTITDYLVNCYEDGFIGVLYDLQGQGIPLIIPIDQKAIVRAVKLDSKINGSMYEHFGENISVLKKNISREIARGISTGTSYQIIAKNIKQNMIGDYKNPKGSYAYAVKIARTEGHRIQIQSTMDAQGKAKKAGANIKKQWDSALDGRTRPRHRLLDGQIRELDEDFEVEGKSVSAPGMFGDPAEDCNCRCALLQRAKWTLDEEELNTLKERAEYFEIDKSSSFKEYKKKYLKEVDDFEKNDIIENVYNPMSEEQYFEYAEEHRKNISEKIRKSIYRTDWDNMQELNKYGYINSDYSLEINCLKRKDPKDFDGSIYENKFEKVIKNLQEAIANNILNENISAVRYLDFKWLSDKISQSSYEELKKHNKYDTAIKELLKKKIINDNQFISASLQEEFNVYNNRPLKMIIKADKGTHAFVTENKMEREIIFDESNLLIERIDVKKDTIEIVVKIINKE